MAEEERDRKWTVLRLRGLRKRWIVNTILPVLVLLMLLVTLVSVGVSTYYYSSMENGLMKQAEAMSQCFQRLLHEQLLRVQPDGDPGSGHL